jgi:undecaprenyl-diphosphatase
VNGYVFIAGFATSLRVRRIQTRAERLAWLVVLATIPVGLSGLALEHLFRTALGKPIPAAVFFLIVNGGILLGRERLRRRSAAPVNAVAADTDTPATPDGSGSMGIAADERPAQMSLAQEILIGCAQILALLPPEVPA